MPDRSAAARELLSAAFQPRKAVPLPAGYRLRRVDEARFAVALPSRWLALTRFGVAHPGTAKMLVRADRRLASYVTGLAMPDSPLKLVAFETLGEDTSLSVLVTEMQPGLAFEEWSREIARQVRAQESFVPPLRERRVALPAGDALRLDYVRRTGGRLLATTQFVVVRDGKAYILVFATPPDERSAHEAVFQQAARSLALGR